MFDFDRQYKTDVLIIGAGAAGARAALAAAEAGSQVILTNKGPFARSGITLTAGGGTQAPFHADDSVECYFKDTVEYGYYLADQDLAWALAEDSCDRIKDMERYGVRFKKNDDGSYLLSKFPGHSFPRNVGFVGGGIGMLSPLKKACKKNLNITILEDVFITGLVETGDAGNNRICGAAGLSNKDGELILIQAAAVIIATGGCQQIWDITDCPADATGDGLAIAFRAGAKLVDMEMILFYPSVIIWPPAARGAFVHYEFLDPSRLDGEILDSSKTPVLPKPVPVRDQAMRMMYDAICNGRGTPHGGLWWYVGNSPRGKEYVASFLDNQQYRYIRSQGLDPVNDYIEVAPGAHYQLGGILIDEHCQTTRSGLFCTPEAGGNFEGANRLSGSALGGTQVFGARAGLSAHLWAKKNGNASPSITSIERELDRLKSRFSKNRSFEGARRQEDLRKHLKTEAQQALGVYRNEASLNSFMKLTQEMLEEIRNLRVPFIGKFNQPLMELLELESMCEIAYLIAESALLRTESRGHHFRSDYPTQDDKNWLLHTAVAVKDGQVKLEVLPIKVTKYPLPKME